MHADDDVRAPAFEQSANVTDATLVKKLARVRADAIDDPVVVLHPLLAIAQQPVVKTNEFVGEMMRFFDGAHHANRVRLAVEKLLHAGNDRGRGRAMSATGVGGDDKDLWEARLG